MGAQDDRSYLTSIAIGFSIAIPLIAVSLRLFARKLHNIAIGADDYAIIVGAVFTIGDSITYIFTNKYGNGRHFDTIHVDDLTRYWTTFYAAFQLYGVAITAIKISVLLFYRRVFSTPQFRKWIYGVGALVIIWLLVNNFMAAFQCTPARKYYKQEVPGHCIDPLAFVLWIQVPNIILDVIILCLPVPAVLRLQMSRMRKASVLAIFLLGGLSCIIAIIRLVVLVNSNLQDITYGTGKCSWTVIEPAIEVLSACLPTMAPFLSMRTHWPRLRSSLRSLLSSSRHRSQSEIEPYHSFNDTAGSHYGAEVKSQALGRPLKKQISESDEIPLKSIKVRQDLDWMRE